jgi:lipoprotein-anchoring transpeptidase ErfK/SrfK
MSPPEGAGEHDAVTIVRAAVLLTTLLLTGLLGPGVAVAAPGPAASTRAAEVPCRATARACVDLSTNQAWLRDDGGRVVEGPVRISHGRAGFRTPPGTFRVSFKNRDHFSSIYHQPMPWSVFFNGGIAFHQGSVRTTSHGCIHLPARAARTFFANLAPGDVVQVVR